MRTPSVNSSTYFPSWLTNMTACSLFISIFGLALFSIVFLGTDSVDMYSLIKASQGLPDLLSRFRFLGNIYSTMTGWMPKVYQNFNNIVIEDAWDAIVKGFFTIIQFLLYIIAIIPVGFVAAVLTPVYIIIDLYNLFGSIFGAISGVSFYAISLAPIESALGGLV